MLAVVKIAGKQYKIKDKEILKVDKIKGNVGDKVENKEILLSYNAETQEIKIGRPFLDGVKVIAEILEQGKERKLDVIKYKRKTRYRKKIGHRKQFTKIKVLDIK